MKLFRWIILGCLIGIYTFVIPATGTAQQKEEGRAMLYFIAKDDDEPDLQGIFYSFSGPMVSDPVAPKFIFASRNKNLLLGIGGYVRLRASYDFRGVCNSDDFHTFDISVPNAGNPSQELRMNAGSSRLFMRLIANTKRLGRLVAYIESDFLGDNRAFRLRQATISFLGLTFGQTLTTFADASAYAPSLDQNGGIVALNQRNPMIRYQGAFGKHFGFAVSAELPPFSGTYQENITAKATAQMPDIPFYLQYNWSKSHLRLSGIFRDLPYKDVLHSSYHRAFGIGGKFSGKIVFNPTVETVFYASYGKGISTYSLDLSGAGVDILPDYTNPGRMFAPRTAVYYGGLRINFMKKLYSGISYSYLRLYTDREFRMNEAFDAAEFYNYAQSATASLIWDFLPSATVGIEYLWGRRTNFDGSYGHANRIYTSIRYNF